MTRIGGLTTVTKATAVLVPQEFEAETVYAVVTVGLTTIGFVVWLVDHVYEVEPVALNVALCPAQIVFELTDIVGVPITLRCNNIPSHNGFTNVVAITSTLPTVDGV